MSAFDDSCCCHVVWRPQKLDSGECLGYGTRHNDEINGLKALAQKSEGGYKSIVRKIYVPRQRTMSRGYRG